MDQHQLLFNLRKIRELRGYGQEFMANQLEISTKTYSRIESGETKLPVMRLDKISEILGVSISEILEFDSNNAFLKRNEDWLVGKLNFITHVTSSGRPKGACIEKWLERISSSCLSGEWDTFLYARLRLTNLLHPLPRIFKGQNPGWEILLFFCLRGSMPNSMEIRIARSVA